MRFMVLVKANKESEKGVLPTEQELKEMGKFNDELIKAGAMLAGEGLHPSSKGVRLDFSGNRSTVIDGPFAETKELLAGFWIVQFKSLAEAIEVFKRAPFKEGELELRQIYEEADFGQELVSKAPEVFEKERQFREQSAKR